MHEWQTKKRIKKRGLSPIYHYLPYKKTWSVPYLLFTLPYLPGPYLPYLTYLPAIYLFTVPYLPFTL